MQQIDNSVLYEITGIKSDFEFQDCVLGLVNSATPRTLTFLDEERFIEPCLKNHNIEVILIEEELQARVKSHNLRIIPVNDARFNFWILYNYMATKNKNNWPSVISEGVSIHPSAFVSDLNVKIGRGTRINANATVHADVEVGENCVIHSGVVIGAEGFEFKKTRKGMLTVLHDGKVVIGNEVHIFPNSCITKGFHFQNTIIGDETKINNLVLVSHGVQIGRRCLITSNVTIAGSSSIGDDVWVSPSVTINNGINIATGAKIGIGAVVSADVLENQNILTKTVQSTIELSNISLSYERKAKNKSGSDIDFKVVEIAKKVFPLSDDITVDSVKDEILGWDSLGTLTFIFELQEFFGVKIPEQMMPSIDSINDIVKIIKNEGLLNE